MNRMLRFAAMLGFAQAAATSVASAAYVTVGDGCQYAQLQAAIDAAHGDTDTIHVRADYHGKPVTITRKQLYIYGGYPSCDAAEPITYTGNPDDLSWLDGSLDGANRPVLVIEGRSVVDLRNFLISNGHNASSTGGGIRFRSSGDLGHLELHTVDIKDNGAGYGAGVFYDGGADANTLVLHDYTLIHANSAQRAGGGLRLEGNVHLVAKGIGLISDNIAYHNDDDGTGGGIQMLDETTADISSPGINGFAFLSNNHAAFGGGIALLDSAAANFYMSAPYAPSRIEHNDASFRGGGAYLDGNVQLCLAGAGINANSAIYDGAAISAEGASDQAALHVGVVCNTPGDAVPCQPGTPCNAIADNWTSFGESSVVADRSGRFHIDWRNVAIRGNSGGRLISMKPQLFDASVDTCEITGNSVSDVLVANTGDQRLTFSACTIAGNDHGNGAFHVPALLTLRNTIAWNEGNTFDARPNGNVELVNVIDSTLENASDFGQFVNVLVADPQFVGNGDYHLLPTSPAIDRASDGTGPSADLDVLPRPVDIPSIPGGPYDLGAYEVQGVPMAETPILANGFD